jgi:hypothetical protein
LRAAGAAFLAGAAAVRLFRGAGAGAAAALVARARFGEGEGEGESASIRAASASIRADRAWKSAAVGTPSRPSALAVRDSKIGLALQRRALLDQRLEDLAALGLRLGKGAHAGQPDLLGGVLDHPGQVALQQPGGRSGLVLGQFLELLDHLSTSSSERRQAL